MSVGKEVGIMELHILDRLPRHAIVGMTYLETNWMGEPLVHNVTIHSN